MKTIKYSVITVAFFLCLLIFLQGCRGDGSESIYDDSTTQDPAEEIKESVYAAPDTQDIIYEMIQESKEYNTAATYEMSLINGIIVKESITPLYRVSFLDYVETGELEITLLWDDHGTPRRQYYAKLINENGEYVGKAIIGSDADGGNLSMGLAEVAKIAGKVMGEYERGYYQASCSYADHAERIKMLLGSDELISAEDVKLVCIEYVGDFFFVEYEGETKVIPIGHTDANEDWGVDFGKAEDGWHVSFADANAVLSIAELERHLDEQVVRYNQLLKENGAENDTNFEKMKYVRESAYELICEVSPVNNIINIYDYLGIDKEE